MSDPIVGIDLGTTNSVVAVCDDQGNPRVLADENGYAVHPSVVSFHPNGSVVVGAEAKQRRIIDPRNTVYSVKRLIGRSFRSKEVTSAAGRAPYQIKEGVNQQPVIVTRAGEFAVPEVSAIVLDHMRNLAKKALTAEIGRAVITVPANFTDAQRSATATAGAIAGLTVVRVLNEPTAAALAYGHRRQLNRVIAVYDFGGGTFDVTVLRLTDQVYEVLGTAGDSFLGGDDLDERLVDHMVGSFLDKERVDLRSNEVAMQRLRAVAEQTKIELSRRTRAIVKIDEIAYGPGGKALDLSYETTRDEFVTRTADVIDRTFPVCEAAVKTAGVQISDIEDIVLVGGTTKIPYVRDRVAQFFKQAPRTDVNPDEAVALGAALQANALQRLLASGGRRQTARSSVAPPAPPMEARPRMSTGETTTGGSAAGGRMTAPRFSTEEQTTAAAADPLADAITETRGPAPGGETRNAAASAATAGAADDEEWGDATSPQQKRTTTPMGSLPPAAGARKPEPGRHSDVFEAVQLDKNGDATKATGGKALGRITRPSSIPPPPGPLRGTPPPPPPKAGPQAKTMFGVPAAPTARRDDELIPLPEPGRPGLAKSPSGATPTLSGAPDFETARTGVTARQGTVPPPEDAPPAFDLDPAPYRPALPTAGPATPTLINDIAPAIPARPGQPPTAGPAHPTLMAVVPPQPTVILGPAAAPSMGALPPLAPTILDVTPHSLGIGTVAGYCEELIRRNVRVPLEMKRMFTTAHDRQDSVPIRVCSGESRRIDDNLILGDLVLDGLEPRPRGETQIEVTFQIDASGILNVRARDPKTGREQRASLDVVGALSHDQVESARDRLREIRR